MTKSAFIEAVMKQVKNEELTKKSVTEIVDTVFEVMTKTVKKEKKFSYPNFGTFAVKKRKARKGRNPQTGEVIKIKASKSVSFKPSPGFKKML